jgi:hypothetical protein
MRKPLRHLLCRLPALIAAYAVILQPLFVVLSPPALAHAGNDTLLCTAKAGGASVTPGDPARPVERHDADCCLSAGCLGGASAANAAVPVLLPSRTSAQAINFAGHFASVAAWPNERPHSARAPPV